jgi:uncharacterized repeat protein (TIGR01451 family)
VESTPVVANARVVESLPVVTTGWLRLFVTLWVQLWLQSWVKLSAKLATRPQRALLNHASASAAIAVLVGVAMMLAPMQNAQAEGAWQMGLFEGTSHRQPLRETHTGAGANVLYVDILTPGEVINVHVCGTSETNNIRVRLFDPAGNPVYDDTDVANVSCSSDFNTTWDPAVTNPHQYVAPASGTYMMYLTNNNGTYMNRYDVTVTNSVNDIIDPRIAGGRLWSRYWYFNASSYAESRSTDADLYVVADGGFVDTYFIWELDLNNFAGFVYSLRANDLGVTSPNAAGDVVAGMSVPISGNSIVEKFPIYLGYPAKSFPEPVGGVNISDLSFIDSDGEDSGISPGTTSDVQDSGTFSFTTNLTTTGVYEIIIDTNSPTGSGPDGIYGQGDVFLRGNALPGVNSVVWNGEDNNGVVLPNGAYTATLSVRTGEFHFTSYDVETSGGAGNVGIKMYRAQMNGSSLPTTLYWDDNTVLNSTASDAFNQEGIYDGNHNWGTFSAGGIGDGTYIDTYTFGLIEEPNPVGVAVTENDVPMPTVTKSFSPSTITSGGTSTMSIEIAYQGSIDLTGVSLMDNMPLGMSLVSDAASIVVSGAGCSGFSFGAGTVSGGAELEVTDGNILSGSTCTISAEVTANLPGDLVNTTSGVSSNELATGVVSNGASLIVEPPLAGAPYACDGSIIESESTALSTRLYTIDASVTPFQRQEFSAPVYTPTSGYSYSGLAYNPLDNFLYAIVTDTDGVSGNPLRGSILKIDSSGQVINLGVPVRGPNTMSMPVISDRFSGGTFTEDGRYVVVTDTNATSYSGASIPLVERGLILDIDVTSSRPQVLFNRRHGRDLNDIVAHPDGALYAHTAAEGLMTVSRTTGAVSVIGGNLSSTLSGLVANAWGDIQGHGSDGNFYTLDSASGNSTLLSPLAGLISADTASCAFGGALRKSVSAATVDPGQTVVYTLSVVNPTDSVMSFTLSDTLGDERSIVDGSLVNPLGGTANAYGGTNQLIISGATLAGNSTADVQFEVYFPHDYTIGPSGNQAQLQGLAAGIILSDDPASNTLPDPTDVEVTQNTSLGVSKQVSVSDTDVTFEITVRNYGNTAVDNLALSDDLDTVFGAGNYVVTNAPILIADPGTVTLSSGFTGSGAGAVLFDAATGSTLAIGAAVTVRFTVAITSITDVGFGIGSYANQVEAQGEDPSGGGVADLSMAGVDADPDDNGLPDEEAATLFNLAQLIVIEGVVFEDNGVGGVAHDGVQDSGESALGSVTIELRDNSGSTLIGSTVTAADGRYQIAIPASYGSTVVAGTALDTEGYLAISEYFREDPGNTGSVTDGRIDFTPLLSHPNSYKLDFGRVRRPVWVADSVADKEPGGVVYHSHRYTPHSSGTLDFAIISETSLPSNPTWQSVLFIDDNCNGSLDVGEDAVSGSIPVNVVSSPLICVISKVFVPTDVSDGDTYTYSVEATLTYTDDTSTGHGLIMQQTVTDLTRVISTEEGLLVLSKTVRNVTTNGIATTSNQALPGDTLSYNIVFSNSGGGAISELLISDHTPAYSALAQPVTCPATLPDGITGCTVVTPTAPDNTAGYSGDVQWSFNGTLSAGASGELGYQVSIE